MGRLFAAALITLAFGAAALPSFPAFADTYKIKVYAAASLTAVFQEISQVAAKYGQPPCLCVHAASSTLARQIERGAPADVYISANSQWVDYLRDLRRLDGAPRLFATNRLVLIKPADSSFAFKFSARKSLAKAIEPGWLALADPDHVPAGIYAMAGLKNLGQWRDVASRVARAPNVRAALAFVVRKETVAGVVYESDARSETRVHIADRFPPASHPEIRYMAAVTSRQNRHRAARYLEFLTSGPVSAIVSRHGFLPPP